MVHLRTLGELRLEEADASTLSSRRKELVLLAYLARRAPRPLARAQAAALLWPERDERRARQSLRQALLELRQLVGDGLVVETDLVRLAPGSVELDAATFEREIDEGKAAEAVARWGGDFLPGAEDVAGEDLRGWLEAERERLRRRLALALAQLVEEAQRNGAWHQAIEWAERWTSTLPLDQQGHLRLLRLLHVQGRSAEALARYAALLAQLRTLEIDPAAELEQLARQLERGADPSRHPPAHSAVLLTPDMVGRGAATGELEAAWHRASDGAGVAIVVEGELGIGKTRLCQEFLRRLEQEGGKHLAVQARPRKGWVTAEPDIVPQLVSDLAGAAGLAAAPPASLAMLATLTPAVAERFPALAAVPAAPDALGEAFRDALIAVAEETPTVLFVDDLGLADPASRRVVLSLMENPPARVLLLAAVRTGDEEPTVVLPPAPSVRRLKLQPLSDQETELLLSSMLELPLDDRRYLASRIHQQGGGNPFYMVELVSALADDGTLTAGERGIWQLTKRGSQLPLPSSVREVISRRIARLTEPGRKAIEAAAVLAFPFDRALLAEVEGESPVTVEAGLNELLLHRLLRESGTGGRYEFAHEMVRHHVERGVPVDRSEILSSRASVALERLATDQPDYDAALFHHRARAAWVTAARRRRRLALAAGVIVLAGLGLAIALRPEAPSAGSISRVLWVDDSPEGNAGVMQQLKNLGVQVTTALNTRDALQRYDPSVHQLVISDMGRFEGPNDAYVGRAGFALLDGLRARRADVQVVFCTSERAVTAFRAEALSAGAIEMVADCRDILRFIGF
jgi:DNA-binding SARP family transcriptional activator/CheY-like chemotaxis protein